MCLKACKVTLCDHVHTTDEPPYMYLDENNHCACHYECTAELTSEIVSVDDPTELSVLSTKCSVADYSYSAGDTPDCGGGVVKTTDCSSIHYLSDT